MIPLDGAAYIGTHGLETMAADGACSSSRRRNATWRTIQRGRRGGRARPRLRGAGRRARGQAHGARRPLPPGRGRGGHAARDPHPRDRAGAGARARHRHRPLRLRGAAAAAVHQGDGGAAAAGRRRRLHGHGLRRRPHRHHRASPPSATGAERDARRAPGGRGGHGRDAAPVVEAADVLVRATPGVHEVLSRLARRSAR